LSEIECKDTKNIWNMQILGHKNVRKTEKMQKLPMSDSIRHNGHRKRPAFNAGEIDEDKTGTRA
jgi:hypothetical protein